MIVYEDKRTESCFLDILNKEQPHKILLFTGKESYANSDIKDFFDTLTGKYDITRYSDFNKNPDYVDVLNALKSTHEASFDMIVALGGGSVIDFAKLYALFSKNIGQFELDFQDVSSLSVTVPLVAIPTTSGSGSEATHFAVMYKKGEKYSVASQHLLPKYIIIDPILSYSMSKYLTACSGMDAFCQALESMWAKNATNESRQYAVRALKLIWPNIKKAFNSPDELSRKAMSLGAYYAGKAINISKTTAPHALAYYLTDKHGISHGEAVAMNIHHFIEINWPALNQKTIEEIQSIFKVKTAFELKKLVNELKRDLGLRKDITEIPSLNLDLYLNSVNLERLANNPIAVELVSLKKMMY